LKALGLDIGGTHVACAALDGERILAAAHMDVPDAGRLGAILPQIERHCAEVLNRAGLGASDCLGIAVSFPGIIDVRRGRILSTPKDKYVDSSEVDLVAWARERFSLPLRIDNDARMALLGERRAGAARGFDDIALMTFGTGVGGAATIDGRLVRGRHFQAATLGGHIPAHFEGRACICGAIGCVEAEASTWALPGICRSWPGFAASALAGEARLDFEALFRHSAAGDAVAAAIADRCLRVWAAGAVGLIHAYDPEVIVFAGSVMRSRNRILPFLTDYIHRHAWTPWGRVEVRAAALGSDAALMGALPLLEEPC
jgi:glucokinase